MKGKIALIAGGIAVALVALTAAAAGGTAIWADSTQRDSHGYVSTGSHPFSSTSRAITSKSIELHTGIPHWLLGKIRIEATAGARPVFVGIARTRDVDAYLAGVDRISVTDVGFDPFRAHYARQAGTRVPGRPAAQSFWVAST